jgi:2-amino-4-hydroxy-6-hydroxymethyldihydropteridine diphosphokinase
LLNTVVFLTGSNVGNSMAYLNLASQYLQQHVGTLQASSAIYKTEAWGLQNQAAFLNQVLIITTTLNANAIMPHINKVETEAARVRTIKNAPRTLDVDILFYNNDIINTKKLIIPHPQIANRMFTLVPLNQLIPNFIHPVHNHSINTLLKLCKDTLMVEKVE